MLRNIRLFGLIMAGTLLIIMAIMLWVKGIDLHLYRIDGGFIGVELAGEEDYDMKKTRNGFEIFNKDGDMVSEGYFVSPEIFVESFSTIYNYTNGSVEGIDLRILKKGKVEDFKYVTFIGSFDGSGDRKCYTTIDVPNTDAGVELLHTTTDSKEIEDIVHRLGVGFKRK